MYIGAEDFELDVKLVYLFMVNIAENLINSGTAVIVASDFIILNIINNLIEH